jgi:hypothetical protein
LPCPARQRPATSIVEETAGMWRIKETGAEYARKIRRESEARK